MGNDSPLKHNERIEMLNNYLLLLGILGFSFSMNGMDNFCRYDFTKVTAINNEGLETYRGDSDKGVQIYATFSEDTKSFSGLRIEKRNEGTRSVELQNAEFWFQVLKEKHEKENEDF